MSQNDDAFKRLQKEWYAKLSATEFKDIENDRNDIIDHKTQSDIQQRTNFKPDLFIEVRDYYIWAGDYDQVNSLPEGRDRTIWVMHANGSTSREISKEVKIHQTQVCRIIKATKLFLLRRKPVSE